MKTELELLSLIIDAFFSWTVEHDMKVGEVILQKSFLIDGDDLVIRWFEEQPNYGFFIGEAGTIIFKAWQNQKEFEHRISFDHDVSSELVVAYFKSIFDHLIDREEYDDEQFTSLLLANKIYVEVGVFERLSEEEVPFSLGTNIIAHGNLLAQRSGSKKV